MLVVHLLNWRLISNAETQGTSSSSEGFVLSVVLCCNQGSMNYHQEQELRAKVSQRSEKKSDHCYEARISVGARMLRGTQPSVSVLQAAMATIRLPRDFKHSVPITRPCSSRYLGASSQL